MKAKQSSAPRCVFCGRDSGVQFAIFNPRFKPSGTACVECEATLPAGTQVPLKVDPPGDSAAIYKAALAAAKVKP